MKFYGVDLGSTDEVVQQEAMKKASAAFFESSVDGNFGQPPSGQSADDAAKIFHGVDERKLGHQLGAPIPGYSGHNRRIEADNIFGTTYEGSRKNAVDSNGRI